MPIDPPGAASIEQELMTHDRDHAQTRTAATGRQSTPVDPGPMAIGTWSGGRFMRFGEALDDERLQALITPDKTIDTIITELHGIRGHLIPEMRASDDAAMDQADAMLRILREDDQ